MEISKENTNIVYITGFIVESRLKDNIATHGANTGKHYISGDIMVKCVLDKVENIIPVSLYSFEVTKDNIPSKLYASYKDIMEHGVGRRVTISGSLQENRFWSAKKNQIVSTQRIAGRFINDARNNQPDEATFEFSGFVGRNLAEKVNKEGKVYLYEITLGQADYKDQSANLFRFNIDPSKTDMIKTVTEKYTSGSTVSIRGNIRYIVSQYTKEKDDEKLLFGEKQVQTSVITNRYFYIVNGNDVITGGTAYTLDDIKRYKEAIAAKDVDITAKAKSTGASSDSDEPLSNIAASLI